MAVSLAARPSSVPLALLAFSLFLAACGQNRSPIEDLPALSADSDAGPFAVAADAGQADAGGKKLFELGVVGYTNENGAGASIIVRENDGVWLDIGAGLSGDGFIQMRIFFGSPEEIVGTHEVNFLPAQTAAEQLGGQAETGNASASLAGTEYTSLLGEGELEVQEGGSVSGTFAIQFVAIESVTTNLNDAGLGSLLLEGTFSGPVNTSCYSRVIAHPTWLPGGAYCEELGY